MRKIRAGSALSSTSRARNRIGSCSKGLQVLENLAHRGAQGCDPCTGDGVGILLQVPHEFFKRVRRRMPVSSCLAQESTASGMLFLPPDARRPQAMRDSLHPRDHRRKARKLLGWRDVPVKSDAIGVQARKTEPFMRQVFIARGFLTMSSLNGKLYVIRKQVEKAIRESAIEGRDYFYISSLSANTIVYKGLLLPHQMARRTIRTSPMPA